MDLIYHIRYCSYGRNTNQKGKCFISFLLWRHWVVTSVVIITQLLLKYSLILAGALFPSQSINVMLRDPGPWCIGCSGSGEENTLVVFIHSKSIFTIQCFPFSKWDFLMRVSNVGWEHYSGWRTHWYPICWIDFWRNLGVRVATRCVLCNSIKTSPVISLVLPPEMDVIYIAFCSLDREEKSKHKWPLEAH